MIYFQKRVTEFFNIRKRKRLIRGLISTQELLFKMKGNDTKHSENKGKARKIAII